MQIRCYFVGRQIGIKYSFYIVCGLLTEAFALRHWPIALESQPEPGWNFTYIQKGRVHYFRHIASALTAI